jgi:hypothetical protein
LREAAMRDPTRRLEADGGEPLQGAQMPQDANTDPVTTEVSHPRSAGGVDGCAAPQAQPREWLGVARVAGLVVASCTVLLLANGREWFWQDDFQCAGLPAYLEVGKAWTRGEVPLLSRSVWNGGALAGELQYGVFSAFLTGCNLILAGVQAAPLTAAFALAVVHLLVLATGAYCLARRRGLPPNHATLAALALALSGYVVLWGTLTWFSTIASFAWLPWYWYGLELALDSRRSVGRLVPGALALYCMVTAGWPLTVIMAALVAAGLCLQVWCRRRSLLAPWPIVATSALGLVLAAPAWLTFLEYLKSTCRSQTPWLPVQWPLTVPWKSLPALVFPILQSWWTVWGPPKPHTDLELAGGLVPTAVVFTALMSRHGRSALCRHWLLVALALVGLGMALTPGLGNFRYSFRWLPLFFLGSTLLAAHLLHALQQADSTHPCRHWLSRLPRNAGVWALTLVGVVGGLALGFHRTLHGSHPLLHFLVLAGLCSLWAALGGPTRPMFLRAWLPVAVVVCSSLLAYARSRPHLEYQQWPWAELKQAFQQRSFSDDVRYLSCHNFWENYENSADPNKTIRKYVLPGNMPMFLGVEFVNGYTANFPRGTCEVLGLNHIGSLSGCSAAGMTPPVLLERESQPGGLLATLGVDGLVLPSELAPYGDVLRRNGWHLEAASERAFVYHRNERTRRTAQVVMRALVTGDRDDVVRSMRGRTAASEPWYLLTAGDATGEVVEFGQAVLWGGKSERNSAEVEVANSDPEREALVVFQRCWVPGYRASLNGSPLAVEQFNLLMPAVRLPPGSEGTLELRYLPKPLVAGCWLAGGGLVLTVLLSLGGRWGRAAAPVAAAGPQAVAAANPRGEHPARAA